MKELNKVSRKDSRLVIRLGGKTMEKRMDCALSYIQDDFILERKEKGEFIVGKNPKEGIFYFMIK